MAKLGRPPIVLDDLRSKRIVDAVRAGLSLNSQAAKGGISVSLLKEWFAAGRNGDERFVAFVAKVAAAKADWEARMLSVIDRAFEEDCVKSAQHALTLLKVRCPETYSERAATAAEELSRVASEDSDLEIARSVLAALESKRGAA